MKKIVCKFLLIALFLISIFNMHTTITTFAASSFSHSSFYNGSPIKADVNNVDWTNVVKINNFQEFNAYITKCFENGITKIAMICVNNYKPLDAAIFGKYYVVSHCSRSINVEDSTTKVVYEYINYPGTRIALSFLKNNTNNLSNRELMLYNIASDFINNKLNKNNPKIMQEMQIHDFICNTTKFYDSPEHRGSQQEFTSALGVFLNKEANCQGYTDAFYMLCKMAGFNVGRVYGTANDDLHLWNTININGYWYMVDLTFDDTIFPNDAISYIYFNIGKNDMVNTHSWEYLSKQVKDSLDGNYLYLSQYGIHGNIYNKNSPGAFYSDISNMLLSTKKPVQVMTKNFSSSSVNGVNKTITDLIKQKTNSNLYANTSTYNLGNYSFLYIKYGISY